MTEWSKGGYQPFTPDMYATVYNHGDHRSLTEWCTGQGKVCDRILTKTEIDEWMNNNGR